MHPLLVALCVVLALALAAAVYYAVTRQQGGASELRGSSRAAVPASGGMSVQGADSVALAPAVPAAFDAFRTVVQAPVIVGTSALDVVLDTGSSYLVVALQQCRGCPPDQLKYDPAVSPSALRELDVTNQQVQYGSQTDTLDGYRDTLLLRTQAASGRSTPRGALVLTHARVAGVVRNSGTTASNILGIAPLRRPNGTLVSPLMEGLEASQLGATIHFVFPASGSRGVPRVLLGAAADPAAASRRWLSCVPALPFATTALASTVGTYYILRCLGMFWVPHGGGPPQPLPHPAYFVMDTGTTLLLLPHAVAGPVMQAAYAREATWEGGGGGRQLARPARGTLLTVLGGSRGGTITLSLSGAGLMFRPGAPLLQGMDDAVYAGAAAGTPQASPEISGVGIWGLHAMRGRAISFDAGALRVGVVPGPGEG